MSIEITLAKLQQQVTEQTDECAKLVTSMQDSWQEIDQVHNIAKHNHQAVHDWQTKTGQVTLKDLDNKAYQVDTLATLINETQKINPHPEVMSKAQFDALRQMRKQQYAGSGFVEWGKHYLRSGYASEPINEGLFSVSAVSYENTLSLGISNSIYSGGNSRTLDASVIIDGVSLNLTQHVINSYGTAFLIKMPPAPDGTKTYDSATGTVTQHSSAEVAFASETQTNKVITSRKDLVFLESWHEIIADKDVVYPLGNVQYGASSYQGIALLNNLVAQGYSAFGEWDTNTKGYGVKWSTLSAANRIKFLKNPEHNIYYDPEAKAYIQVRYRVRVVEGKTDSWRAVQANNPLFAASIYSPVERVIPRGALVNPYKDLGRASFYYYGIHSNNDQSSEIGMLKSRTTNASNVIDAIGFEGKCFAIPIALVQRLNQGAYHPVYNPMGTGRRRVHGGYYYTWYQTHDQLTEISSVYDCFDSQANNGGGNKGEHGFSYIENGAVYCGRSDQYKYYDAIYAGQVEDLRLNANKLDVNQLREDTMRKAVAGTLRGKEKLPFTRTYTYVKSGGFFNNTGYWLGENGSAHLNTENLIAKFGKRPSPVPVVSSLTGSYHCGAGYIYRHDTQQLLPIINKYSPDDLLYIRTEQDVPNGTLLTMIWSFDTQLEMPSAEFDSLPWVDIIGSPDNISQLFPNGVVGQWNPNHIPDGTGARFALNKKVVSDNNDVAIFFNGEKWESNERAMNLIQKSNSVSHPVIFGQGNVALYFYETSSVSTEPANNSNVIGEVGNVYASCHSSQVEGSRLTHSLTGLIGKATIDPAQAYIGSVDSYRVRYKKIDSSHNYSPKHKKINIPKQGNASPLIKSLYLVTEKNGLLYLQFNGAELKHNGTDWGDDQTIPIISGENVKTDLNGNTVKVFCHHTQLPLGIASH
ncbi:hypothetical protein PSECIP111854_02057 [Pseudoalteromonas sp. CIP111854]|uniref:Uncharacterized protein n=1 Tax=Pseudoalteromonas holothuriae TaxID=2963714 RepID=A0A9W4QXH7_9GAMM|nr:hypothetical protein [Pseudoalteromonas sp. CIP111854]CAH9057732.1 hypothetical protein PSECIP111854_02057 [Pseudoalteromonas sp. CIP111854]